MAKKIGEKDKKVMPGMMGMGQPVMSPMMAGINGLGNMGPFQMLPQGNTGAPIMGVYPMMQNTQK